MYSSKKAQLARMKADEAISEIFSEYANFADIFLPKLAIELPKYTRINNHPIELVDD